MSDGTSRLRSLDVLRGLTVFGMIVVNSPGNETAYWPLDHSPWNGLTPTDLVFPFFMVVVGASLVLSLRRRLAEGATRAALLGTIIRRTAILFGLGLFLNGFPFYHLATIRIPGVLQRIALGYFFGSLFYLWTSVRTQIVAAGTILIGYWLVMTHVHVPGFPVGDLSREGNVAAWLDRAVLAGHMYRPVYDPEGILSTFPAVVSVLTGMWASLFAFNDRALAPRRLLTWGAAAVAGALIWARFFPINKALWSSSFVLVTTGLALLLWAALVVFVDDRPPARWQDPFLALGSSAIAAYMLHILGLKIQNLIHIARPDGSAGNLRFFLTDHLFRPWMSPEAASATYALLYTLGITAIFWMLWRRRITIKV